MLQDGIVLFNKRKFFEAHEVWENLWLNAKEEKKFLQALIFIAGAYYHYQQENIPGAKLFLSKGSELLEKYPEKYLDLDVKRIKEDTKNNLEKIKQNIEIKFHVISKF